MRCDYLLKEPMETGWA